MNLDLFSVSVGLIIGILICLVMYWALVHNITTLNNKLKNKINEVQEMTDNMAAALDRIKGLR